MRISIGSDERSHLTDSVIEELQKRGIQVETCGALREGKSRPRPTKCRPRSNPTTRGYGWLS